MKTKIAPPALRINGGKWSLADWIISHLPVDHARRDYGCGFFGAGSILLRKKPAAREYAGDADLNITNFFESLRDHAETLIQRIRLTPYHFDEFARCLAKLQAAPETLEPLERARCFYACCFMSRRYNRIMNTGPASFRRRGNPAGSSGGFNPARVFGRTAHLHALANRLKRVIFLADYREVLEAVSAGQGGVLYLDPEYPREVQLRPGTLYDRPFHSRTDHVELLERVLRYPGPVLLSSYRNLLYDARLLSAGWAVSHCLVRSGRAQGHVECLYLSPEAARLCPIELQAKIPEEV